jgi:hypothetical protein
VKTLAGTVSELNLEVEGGTPQTLNVIPDQGVQIPLTTLVRDQRLVVPLPADGTLTAGPFTPSPGSQNVRVMLGGAGAQLTFSGGAPTRATCAKPSPSVYRSTIR